MNDEEKLQAEIARMREQNAALLEALEAVFNGEPDEPISNYWGMIEQAIAEAKEEKWT